MTIPHSERARQIAGLLKGYNERGLADVLDGAAEQIQRASNCLLKCKTGVTAPAVSQAYRREADLCITEALLLVAAVAGERGLSVRQILQESPPQ